MIFISGIILIVNSCIGAFMGLKWIQMNICRVSKYCHPAEHCAQCTYWNSVALGSVEPADALLILFQRTGIPLPPIRAQSADLRTLCVVFPIYFMRVWEKWIGHHVFLFAVCNRLNKSSWPKDTSQTNQNMNTLMSSICRSSPLLSAFALLSCFCGSFLILSFLPPNLLVSVPAQLFYSLQIKWDHIYCHNLDRE